MIVQVEGKNFFEPGLIFAEDRFIIFDNSGTFEAPVSDITDVYVSSEMVRLSRRALPAKSSTTICALPVTKRVSRISGPDR